MSRVPACLVALAMLAGGCSATPGGIASNPTAPAGTDRPPASREVTPSTSPESASGRATTRRALDGSIVFMRNDPTRDEAHGAWHLWTACADLSDATPLPGHDGRSDGWATWSPDGLRIAFNANWDDPELDDGNDVWDVYTSAADGSDVRRLTRSTGLEGDPGWSPDGSLIAYDSTEPGKSGIWVMAAADGRHAQLVTAATPEEGAFAPRFSPDGKRIVFAKGLEGATALWVVDLDGSNLRRITPPDLAPAMPSWSPDGRTIVFDASSRTYPFQNLFKVSPDGSGLRSLDLPSGTEGAAEGYADPVWSPDGSMVMTGHGLHQGSARAQVALATVLPDGSDPQWVAGASEDGHRPDWTARSCR